MKTIEDRLVPSDDLYDLAFDQFSRQYLVKRYVEQIRTKKRMRILDIGGNNGRTKEFFPHDEVLVVDLYDRIEPGYLKASALDLPLKDNSYDIVVSFDVFEHIAGGDREQFLSELCRVSATAILIAAPFSTTGVASAETELNDFYRYLNSSDHRWLKEHIDNILPQVDQIESFLIKKELAFEVMRSNQIVLWSIMQHLIFLADATRTAQEIASLNRFYNQHMEELGDSEGPSYRQIYCISTTSKHLKKLPTASTSINIDTLNAFVDLAGRCTEQIIRHNESAQSQAHMIEQKNAEIDALHQTLEAIRGSITYRFAIKLSRIKHAITRS